MGKEIDPAMTLRKIENRKNNKNQPAGAHILAVHMVEKAQEFLASPSTQTLAVFARSEKDWLSVNGRSQSCYADEFRQALKVGFGPVRGNVINNSWNPNYAPTRGYIYAFWTEKRPSHLKIGSTREEPIDRLANFEKRYNIQGLKIVFFFKINSPAAVEKRMHETLKPYRRKLDRNDSLEWFEVTPTDGFECAKRTIEYMRIEIIGRVYVDKKIDEKSALSRRALSSSNNSPLSGQNGYLRLGSRRVTRADVDAAVEKRNLWRL